MGDEQVQQDEVVAGDEATREHSEHGDDKLVPVSEAIRYRKRAQAAEQELGAVGEQLQTLRQELNEAQQTISHLERRQQIDALLSEADAVDLEAARLLTEQAVREMDEPDVSLAVADLRRHKPYLFRQRRGSADSAMAAQAPAEVTVAEDAAQQAVSTGNRRDLLQYLRLRRGR